DRPVVLCVGHLRPQKAPLDWIRMAQAVSSRRPEAFFLWVGGGQLQPSFFKEYRARLKPESFLHLGNQRDPALAYQAASLFALSSLWEGMPYALLDAMAWGLPCAATAVTGCRDLIADGTTGLLAGPGDPDGLAARVLDLLNDTETASVLGAAARTTVERDYTVDSFLAAHESLYEDALRMAG
ncbi:MAG: glycosyltransferase, partial [Chloroflexi bacterium]|nr:glycosyltransferase [Chloroflexota bacterium]